MSGTINRGADLLAFHADPPPLVLASLTREILNFLKTERDDEDGDDGYDGYDGVSGGWGSYLCILP